MFWFYFSLGISVGSLLVSDALKFGADGLWFGCYFCLCAGTFHFGNFWLQFRDFKNITVSLSFLLLSFCNSYCWACEDLTPIHLFLFVLVLSHVCVLHYLEELCFFLNHQIF